MHDTTQHAATEQASTRPASARRPMVAFVLAAVVASAAIVVAVRVVSTSSAEISATTGANGVFRAGIVEIERPDQTVSLFLNADGLYPGSEATGCSVIEYRGSVPASVRLHGDRTGGTGLDEFVELRVSLHEGVTCVDGSISGEPTSSVDLYGGRLRTMWTDHSSYETGVTVAEVQPGASIVIEAVAHLVDDNRAQGLSTQFAFMFEARPS